MHYCEPVYAAVNAVLLSMVCDGVACDADDDDGRRGDEGRSAVEIRGSHRYSQHPRRRREAKLKELKEEKEEEEEEE